MYNELVKKDTESKQLNTCVLLFRSNLVRRRSRLAQVSSEYYKTAPSTSTKTSLRPFFLFTSLHSHLLHSDPYSYLHLSILIYFSPILFLIYISLFSFNPWGKSNERLQNKIESHQFVEMNRIGRLLFFF